MKLRLTPGWNTKKLPIFGVVVHVVAEITRVERRVVIVGVTPTVLVPRGGPKAKAQIVEL